MAGNDDPKLHDVAGIKQPDGRYAIHRWTEPGEWTPIPDHKETTYDGSEIEQQLDVFAAEGDTCIVDLDGTLQWRDAHTRRGGL